MMSEQKNNYSVLTMSEEKNRYSVFTVTMSGQFHKYQNSKIMITACLQCQNNRKMIIASEQYLGLLLTMGSVFPARRGSSFPNPLAAAQSAGEPNQLLRKRSSIRFAMPDAPRL